MKTILRYEISTVYDNNPIEHIITAPENAEVLTAKQDGGHQYIYMLGDESQPKTKYHFLTIRTYNHDTPIKPSVPKKYSKYIETIIASESAHTDHIFQAP